MVRVGGRSEDIPGRSTEIMSQECVSQDARCHLNQMAASSDVPMVAWNVNET